MQPGGEGFPIDLTYRMAAKQRTERDAAVGSSATALLTISTQAPFKPAGRLARGAMHTCFGRIELKRCRAALKASPRRAGRGEFVKHLEQVYRITRVL